jgi:antitoxin MazE
MVMNVYVRKWGNSDAVRIPAKTLAAAGIKTDDPVTVREEGGRILIERAEVEMTLEELCARITPENRHEETDWGPPLGKEFW